MTEPTPPKPTRAQRLRAASQQRRDQEKADVRRAILEAASALFLEHGYEGFSLRQVAERIGYSPGTLYLYFADKDAVLLAIVQEGAARFHAVLSAAAEAPDARVRLHQLGRAYMDFGLGYPAHYQLMFMQRTDFLERAGPLPLLAIFDLWRDVVGAAMREGVLQPGDVQSVGDTLWGLLHGVVSIAILMPRFDAARVRAMADAALALMTGGLHTPP